MKYTKWYRPCDKLTVEKAIENGKKDFNVKTVTIRTSGAYLTEEQYNAHKDALKNRSVLFTDYNMLTKDFYVTTEYGHCLLYTSSTCNHRIKKGKYCNIY